MEETRKQKKERKKYEKQAQKLALATLLDLRGAAPPSAVQLGEKAIMQRLPVDTLSRVDAAVAARRVRTSRNTWIIEAVLDKLEADGF